MAPVSEPVARAMAEGALSASEADVAVAVTGVAGPGGSEAKPEGLVWFATATAAGTHAQRRDFGAIGRERVRSRSVETAPRSRAPRHHPAWAGRLILRSRDDSPTTARV